MIFSVVGCGAKKTEEPKITTEITVEAIADTQAPTITPNDITVEYGDDLKFSDLATIEDDGTGEIAVSILSVNSSEITIDEVKQTIAVAAIGKVVIELSATDESGNTSVSDIPIVVQDTVKLVLSLNKKKFKITEGGDAPNFARVAVAKDNVDGDLTAVILVDDSKVDYASPGTYKITYSVKDSSGNKTTKKATLTVAEKAKPKPKKEKVEVSAPVESEIMITRTGGCYHTHK